MAENKITLELDMTDISEQLKPVVKTLEEHYKRFLHNHEGLTQELYKQNTEDREQIAKTIRDYESSLSDYIDDTKKELSKTLLPIYECPQKLKDSFKAIIEGPKKGLDQSIEKHKGDLYQSAVIHNGKLSKITKDLEEKLYEVKNDFITEIKRDLLAELRTNIQREIKTNIQQEIKALQLSLETLKGDIKSEIQNTQSKIINALKLERSSQPSSHFSTDSRTKPK